VREPARQDDHVGAPDGRLLVPDELRVVTEHVLRGVIRVVVAVGSRKDDDGELHDAISIL
jgi:hypothetical protein